MELPTKTSARRVVVLCLERSYTPWAHVQAFLLCHTRRFGLEASRPPDE